MTDNLRETVDGESVTRAFYDIAQLLESGEDSDTRVLRVLEQLRTLVPYAACAVLDAQPGREPRLLTSPGATAGESSGAHGHRRSAAGPAHRETCRRPETLGASGMHLAVPLVGLDEVVGVLFVRGADSTYETLHIRRLSIVAAKLAAYFSMLQASAISAERTRQVEEARQSAEAANRVKDEFLAIVSHELRTPLNTILAWADTLRSTEADESDRMRAFEAIERSVRAETKLIDDLLDLSCIVSATLRLDLRAVEPAKVIRATVQALRSRAEKKAIRLELALDESVMPLIADPQRLRQIVANLVANAIKFTPSGGRVEVHLERAGVVARIRVIDNGSGISPEALPKLFEPFRHADGSSSACTGRARSRSSAGERLGRASRRQRTSRKPREECGRDLHRRAASGGNVRGNAATPEVPPVGERDERALAGIRVLLVDDDRDICEVLQFVLEKVRAPWSPWRLRQ